MYYYKTMYLSICFLFYVYWECDIIPRIREFDMDYIIGEFLGYACGFCTTVAFLPQTIKSITTKNVAGLSWLTYTIYCVGCALWILYGVYLDSFQMVLFNGITLLLNSIILYLIVTNSGRKK